ncbi:MAG: DUF302 domain-containing protein [Methylococcales bacterium]|jgi:uncharacterized protein (DUF302 family)|nr:DUF302 domain-containing protein [Methylococcales bacterium]MBT7444079.1 DUF302 domain-containing protein [Methylococcales bacterium]
MYSFGKSVAGAFDAVVEQVIAALKVEGFGIITDIDIQATMKAKIDVERAPYRILGACNPKLANEAINKEPSIGLLLPCNVVVRETGDNEVMVEFMDPAAVLGLSQGGDLKTLGDDVKGRLERVQAAL